MAVHVERDAHIVQIQFRRLLTRAQFGIVNQAQSLEKILTTRTRLTLGDEHLIVACQTVIHRYTLFFAMANKPEIPAPLLHAHFSRSHGHLLQQPGRRLQGFL